MSTATSFKNIVATVVGLAVVFALALSLANTARAATLSQSQVDAIVNLLVSFGADQATINNVKAALTGQPSQGGSGTGSSGSGATCSATNFTMSHKLGDNGGQVMDIQKFLNRDPDTQVAASGAGSPGNETSYFGARTKAAVIKFQNKYAADILAPVGLSSGTGYWGPSTMKKANELEQARCAASSGNQGSGSQGGSQQQQANDGLTVSAAAQPANSLAPGNSTTQAANVPFTRFTLTAGANDVTVTGVRVKMQGLANKAAFASVVLLDENGAPMGNTKTLDSNNEATIGGTFTVPAGQSRTFTVAANMSSSASSYAGQVASFAVVAVNTSANVSGSLPIVGAAHTINGSLTIGSATAARGALDPNSNASKEIGTSGYIFTSVKLTAGSEEKIRVKSMRFNQSGSASASDVTNVRVVVDGQEYPATVSSDGKYYTVNFGNGIVIDKGMSKEFTLKADIASGVGRTIAFDIYKYTDMVVVGETYGYGITPSQGTGFNSSSPVYDASVVTVTGGTFNSVSKSSAAPAANIAKQKADEVLGAFTVDLKGEGITVGTLVVNVSGAGADEQITNATLVDQNGNVLAGPVDGQSQTTSLSFSSVTFPAGVTTVYVKGMLDSDWDNGDTITLSTNPNSDWSDVTGNTTGNSISLPNSTATMNQMTVRGASLSANTLTQPAARSVVKGVQDFVFARFSFSAANSGEDIRVTAMSVKDTTASGGIASNIDNVELWADIDGDGTYETRIATAQQFDETASDTADTLAFTLDTPFTVPKNGTVNVEVRADVSGSAVTGGKHTINLTSVTATGATSGATVSVSPSGSGQQMTIAAGGTLTTSVDSSSPSASLLLDDTSGEQTIAVFKLAANNVEDLNLQSFTITGSGTSNNEAVAKYVFYAGGNKVGEVVNTGSTATLYPTSTVTIPANGYVLLTVKAVMNDIDGTAVTNGNTVIVGVANASDVVAVGASSGSGATETGTGTAATHTVYEAYPTFAFDSSIPTTLGASTQYKVAKIDITANGNKDVTFEKGGNQKIVVKFQSANTTTSTTTVTLKDSDGNTLDQNTSVVFTSGSASYTADFTSNALAIPAGQTKSVYVYINTAATNFLQSGTGNDTLYAWLDDGTASDLTFSINSDSGQYQEADYVFKNDPAGPVHKD